MGNTLLIFIKNPTAGKVKTRIARTMGDARALDIYRTLLNHTRRIAEATAVIRHLYYSDFIPHDDEWSGALFQKYTQSGNDLGERMSRAFANAFEEGGERVVIIGSDCPLLTSDVLHVAFEALLTHTFVLGEANDGGYYLLGMRHYAPQVFEGVAWSTETVAAHTLRHIEAMGETCHRLPILPDIDTEADWLRYGATLG